MLLLMNCKHGIISDVYLLQFANSQEQRQKLKEQWLTLTDEEKIPFQKRARDHIAKQQYMKECITDALRKDQGGNCSRSYSSLVKATGDWCNRTTIVNWLKSKPDYCLYTKRIRPGLTEANRLKQIQRTLTQFVSLQTLLTKEIGVCQSSYDSGLILLNNLNIIPML